MKSYHSLREKKLIFSSHPWPNKSMEGSQCTDWCMCRRRRRNGDEPKSAMTERERERHVMMHSFKTKLSLLMTFLWSSLTLAKYFYKADFYLTIQQFHLVPSIILKFKNYRSNQMQILCGMIKVNFINTFTELETIIRIWFWFAWGIIIHTLHGHEHIWIKRIWIPDLGYTCQNNVVKIIIIMYIIKLSSYISPRSRTSWE